jgi:hypothetical protein
LGRKKIILHIAGYTVDDMKAQRRRRVDIPSLRKKYAEWDIELRELRVWPFGLTKIPVFEAVEEAQLEVDEVYEENPNALIGLSGHSLGGIIAMITAYSMDVDFLILEDVPFGGSPDWVLKFGKFDLTNEAVITGLRNNSEGLKFIDGALEEKKFWPPILEIRGWFAIGGQLLFGSFPNTGFGKVARFPLLNHHQVWKHQKVVNEVIHFIQSVAITADTSGSLEG